MSGLVTDSLSRYGAVGVNITAILWVGPVELLHLLGEGVGREFQARFGLCGGLVVHFDDLHVEGVQLLLVGLT